MSAYFALGWGLFMLLFEWLVWGGVRLMLTAQYAAAAGLIVGFSMAGHYRWKAARLRLPSWDEYPDEYPTA
jgi:hypothetical protein